MSATVSAYDLHDLVRHVATFVGTDGVTPADPSTVTFMLRNGLGSLAASCVYNVAGASIQRVGVGAYAKDVTVDTDGRWYERWEGTGGVQAAGEWSYNVAKSAIFNL